MAFDRKTPTPGARPQTPADVASRLASRRLAMPRPNDGWRRETYRLSRSEAREKAREWFELYPKAAYMTEIEFWRVTEEGDIEFTIRRLPSAD